MTKANDSKDFDSFKQVLYWVKNGCLITRFANSMGSIC